MEGEGVRDVTADELLLSLTLLEEARRRYDHGAIFARELDRVDRLLDDIELTARQLRSRAAEFARRLDAITEVPDA